MFLLVVLLLCAEERSSVVWPRGKLFIRIIYISGPRLLTKGDPYFKEFSLSFYSRKQCIDVTSGPPGMSR